MCGAFTAVFLLVLILLWMALVRRAPSGTAETTSREGSVPPLGRNGFVIAGGIVLPVVVLVPLLILSLESSAELKQPQEAMTIRVVGKMWWWEVSYPEQGIITANEIHIPAGEKVRLELESTDVVHSLWVPNLNGKRDLIPGITNEFWLQADEPGVYRGQCAEYCGLQHANMVLYVVAHSPAEFREWTEQRQPADSAPQDPDLIRGHDVFQSAGCATCHAVRGTAAAGKAGPDLTHFGSRRTIAGIVPNNRGNVAGWIADPHAIKPGVKMPRTYLHADDLLALTSYLESLQ
jgi:cytochrome c oxidase subunit 2